MAIFLRREIQRCLVKAATFLPEEQLAGLVRRLNLPHKQAVEAEWELVWLVAFAQVGKLRHEEGSESGNRYPDVHLITPDLELIADITTASDVGYQDENPIREVNAAFYRLYRKFRLHGGFTLRVDSFMVGKYGDQKVKLALPDKGKVNSFVTANFEPFIRLVSLNPEEAAAHSVSVGGGNISLAYNPKQRPINHGPGHLSFNVPYSKKRNPVYNALKSKRGQLKESGLSGVKGVIINDASCAMLTTMMRGAQYTIADIIIGFLAETKSVDFVLTVGIQETHPMLGESYVKFKPNLYFKRDMAKKAGEAIEGILSKALALIPLPDLPGYKALYSLERGSPPDPMYGALPTLFTFSSFMEKTEIKVSNRLLVGLLSGEISQAEFRQMHVISGNPGNPPKDMLKDLAQSGSLLTETRVEKCADKDDDYVVLTFGPPDAAATRFRMPSKPKTSD